MANFYLSLGDMLLDLAGADLADRFLEWRKKTSLARRLFRIRNQIGLSEEEVAERLGWSKKRVENFERKEMRQINFEDFGNYTQAIDIGVGLLFYRGEDSPIVARIKHHVNETQKLLNALVEQAEGDEKISKEMEKFLDDEYFLRIATIYAEALLRLDQDLNEKSDFLTEIRITLSKVKEQVSPEIPDSFVETEPSYTAVAI